MIKGYQDRPQQLRRHDTPDIRRSSLHNHADMDALNMHQIILQLIRKDVLRDGDEDGAAERLPEENQRGADRHVLSRQDGLHGHVGLLHAKAHPEAVQDLVADPNAPSAVDFEGRDQARANGDDDGRQDHARRVVADLVGKPASGYAGYDYREHQRDGADTGLDGRHALDALEPDWDVVYHHEHRAASACCVVETRCYASLLENSGRHSGCLVFPDLD